MLPTKEVAVAVRSQRVGRILGACSGLGFILTAGLHATGYSTVNTLSLQVPEDLRALIAMLWLAFSADLVVAGVIVLAAVRFFTALSGPVLAVAGFLPAFAACLQVAYLGFIGPTAILAALAVSTWASAWALRRTANERKA